MLVEPSSVNRLVHLALFPCRTCKRTKAQHKRCETKLAKGSSLLIAVSQKGPVQHTDLPKKRGGKLFCRMHCYAQASSASLKVSYYHPSNVALLTFLHGKRPKDRSIWNLTTLTLGRYMIHHRFGVW